MSVSQSLHRLSTNVRFLTGSLLFPELAESLAERLFLTPPAPRLPESTLFDFIDARASFVAHAGRRLATWRWGPTDARACPMRRAPLWRAPGRARGCLPPRGSATGASWRPTGS